jgi:hypothetical protein
LQEKSHSGKNKKQKRFTSACPGISYDLPLLKNGKWGIIRGGSKMPDFRTGSSFNPLQKSWDSPAAIR